MPPRKKLTTGRKLTTPEDRAASIEQERLSVRRKYKQNIKQRTKFSSQERPHLMELCVVLKIAGYSHTQIGHVIGTSRGQVGELLNEPAAQELMVDLRAAIPQAAIFLLHSYSIEAVQTIASIMRESQEDGMVLKAAIEVLDRAGLPKATKSEASVHKVEEVRTTFTDDGIADALRQASPEVQEQAAQLVEQLEQLLTEEAAEIEAEDTADGQD